MTSGTFRQFPITKIWVDRNKRQRRELTDIEELAQSIARVGLIHPPVIRANGELIVGERRWMAAQSLGWLEMPVQFIEDLSEEELRAVELEENVRRKDIEWSDNCLAVADYHALRLAKEPKWDVHKTAEALGFSRETIDKNLRVAEELRKGNERVVAAPQFSTALNVVRRADERKRAAAIEALIPAEQKMEVPFLHTDFTAWQRDYAGPKFNFIHCDFPYGINADQHDQGAAPSFGGYKDSVDVYEALLRTLKASMANVVAESAHLIFWFAMDHYELTKMWLMDMGWTLDTRPLIWTKSDGTSIAPDVNRRPRWGYETAFFGWRGDRKLVNLVTNWTSQAATKEFHMSEKPKGVLRHFLRMVTDEYTTALDPTCGSGNAIIVARELGAGLVLGLEREQEFYEGACSNWRANSLRASGRDERRGAGA